MLTVERLKYLLIYNPETGIFIYSAPRRRIQVGAVAGIPDKDGYLETTIDYKKHKLHRLAWFYIHGVWPKDQIDHINGLKADNRIINLREATSSQNHANKKLTALNTSGLKGAVFHKGRNKWVAQIKKGGKTKHLGSFETAQEAHSAYCEAAEIIHGEFARAA